MNLRRHLPVTLAALALIGWAAVSLSAPIPGPPSFTVLQNLYFDWVSAGAVFNLKASSGVLHTICFNISTSGQQITAYDNIVSSGTTLLNIKLTGTVPNCLTYDIVFNTGLTISSGTGAIDMTVSYQ